MRNKHSLWVLATLGVACLGLSACFENTPVAPVIVDSEPTRQEAVFESGGCSSDWYQQVESQVNTGDGAGHGPDLGSDEWRSVVEFKLGIRDKQASPEQPALPPLPERNSEDWCRYIDEHHIQDHD